MVLGVEEDKEDTRAFAVPRTALQPPHRGSTIQKGSLVYLWNLRQERRKTPSPPEQARKRLV